MSADEQKSVVKEVNVVHEKGHTCYLSKNAYEAAIEAVTEALKEKEKKRQVAQAELDAKFNAEQKEVADQAEKELQEAIAAEEKRLAVRKDEIATKFADISAKKAEAEAAKEEKDETEATEGEAEKVKKAAEPAKKTKEELAEIKAATEDVNGKITELKADHERKKKKAAKLLSAEKPKVEEVKLTQAESIQACKTSYAQLTKPTIFSVFPATVVSVMQPARNHDVPDDVANLFSFLYIVNFVVKSSNPAETGCENIDVTCELGEDHIATCLAYLPWDKIERIDQYVTKPVTKYVFQDHNPQWTKVLPTLNGNAQSVVRKNTTISVTFNGEPLAVPIGDFKCAPQVEIIKSNSIKCFEVGGKKNGKDFFFVHKAAVKQYLISCDAVLKQEENWDSAAFQMANDIFATVDDADKQKGKVSFSDATRKLMSEYQAKDGPKTPAFNIAQFSARSFPLWFYDAENELAVIEVDLAEMSFATAAAKAAWSKANAEANAASQKAHDLAEANGDADVPPVVLGELEDPMFIGKVKVVVRTDDLATVVYNVDNKWNKVHPFQKTSDDDGMKEGDLYVIARMGDGEDSKTVLSYDIEYLHDHHNALPENLLLSPNVKERPTDVKKRLSQSTCALM